MCPGRSSPWARQSQMYHNRKNILGRLGNYVAPGCKTSFDGTRSQRARIRAPDRNNVLGLSENYKIGGGGGGGGGGQRALVRAPDRNNVLGYRGISQL